MSPIARGNWGQPETSLANFPNVLDYWSLPRSTLSHYRLSANCQPCPERGASPSDRSSSDRFPELIWHFKRTALRHAGASRKGWLSELFALKEEPEQIDSAAILNPAVDVSRGGIGHIQAVAMPVAKLFDPFSDRLFS
jgi:hypothetical protein